MLKAFLVVVCSLVWLAATDENLFRDGVDFFKDVITALPTGLVSGKTRILCPFLNKTEHLLDFVDSPSEPIYFEFVGRKSIQKVRVLRASDLINLPDFSRAKPTVIIINSWRNSLNSINDAITDAYQKRNDANIVMLNTSGHINRDYGKSAKNTLLIGKRLAKGLLSLSEKYDINMVHLVGFSLGAQIAGSAGRFYKEISGRSLYRITGLDPAEPCFYANEMPGLSRSDAEFVDVIHTNPGGLGTQKAEAHVDFFVGGLNTIQSNCRESACSHMRASEYYAESVFPGNEQNFPAKWCRTSISEPSRACKGVIAYMGYLAVESARSGIYYLEVNDYPPFGLKSI